MGERKCIVMSSNSDETFSFSAFSAVKLSQF